MEPTTAPTDPPVGENLSATQDKGSKFGFDKIKNFIVEDKFVLIGVVILGVLLFIGGLSILLSKRASNNQPPPVSQATPFPSSSADSSVNFSVNNATTSAKSASPSASPTSNPSSSPSASPTSSPSPSSSPSPTPSPS